MTTNSLRSVSVNRVRRVRVPVIGAGAAVVLVGLTTAPALAQQPEQRVRFDYATTSNRNGYGWVAPPGVRAIHVEVAGGAGGSDPGSTGRGGKGAVIEATMNIVDPIVFGDLGCTGDQASEVWVPGGPGGRGAGAAENGAAGGGATTLTAGNNASDDAGALLWAGGGGGGGGRGSGFGVNDGGDGGDAGLKGALAGGVGDSGDRGTAGGGAGGGTKELGTVTCLARISVNFGQPGQDAVGAGAGGGGGGGGYEGGCGGGAGSAVTEVGRSVIGSGGGGQAGDSSIRGPKVQSPSIKAANHGEGYVIITYRVG